MAVMGTGYVIIDDLHSRFAELEELAQRLFPVIAEKDAVIAELTATVRAQAAQIADLKAKLAAANKDSSNSSKPPSSDFFKPPSPKRGKGKKKIGGQPGHPRHLRAPFPPEEVDETVEIAPGPCPRCGRAMERLDDFKCRQQAELLEKPFKVTEYRAHRHRCPCCGEEVLPALPAATSGLFGERMTAATAFLKAKCHTSFGAIAEFHRDVLGLPVSRGLLAKAVARASQALAAPHAELCERVKDEAILNVDETGHRDGGRPHWTWAFCARGFTLFRIAPTRGAAVLDETLGDDFSGLIVSDYYGAYLSFHKRHGSRAQYCWAHLIREVLFLAGLPDRVTARFGRRLQEAARRLFRAISQGRSRRCLEAKALAVSRTIKRATANRPGIANLKKRFKENGESYFRFLSEDGIGPTNNAAERALRHCVIDRRVTQGTRGETGQRWCERAWTVVATCAKQGRSAFAFFREALRAYVNGTPAPSLLQNP